MDQALRNVYLREALAQCRFALNAAGALGNVLARLLNEGTPLESRMVLHQEVFRTIHSLLTHASNISQLFWPGVVNPQNGEDEVTLEARLRLKNQKMRGIPLLIIFDRGRVLRQALSLPAHGHALHSRDLRDHLVDRI